VSLTKEIVVNLIDLPWGFWNGLTAWIVLVVHIFGGWSEFPVFDIARSGNWYEFGFLVGAGSPLLGAAGAGARSRTKFTADGSPMRPPLATSR
jgi:hypothetical protein